MNKKGLSTMKNTKPIEAPKFEPLTYKATPVVTDNVLTHDDLLKALYWIWDVMDKASMGVFLIHDTAESAMNHKLLTGNSIHVGVRRLEWESGNRRIVDSIAIPVEQTDNVFTYMHGDVPVVLHVFDEDESISSTDQILYEREYFKVPNPYSRFVEVFGNE